MKHTKEEILNALRIIQDECTDVVCDDCPFGVRTKNTYSCMFKIDENPDDWRIKSEEESVWRAFEE